ncbi:hypothetical protein R1080702_224 [Cyanophage S-RIM32]|jgi:hypothetical protein|uniref:Uncharacterized protein n=1 Tax=Cyanophage S-RIM32 TaxID=1278479 RepID=A0A127KMQ6_9CAUD|nr:hypothetical protein BJD26_gp036 [Cyanophage S-RIM32]AMO43229.1 hypothetical protein R1080702_224 [Cyanophage S-RIM32]
MQTSVILFFSGVFVFLSLIVGIIAGWHINDVVYNLIQKKNEISHPEMYDEDGMWINEELLSVKFVNEEEEEEDDYY